MPQWTSQQQQAIEAQCGSLLLSAAAGSGKTAVLTQRVLHLLTHPEHPVDADRLLIVTFTNAAASEMRSRITDKLALLLEQEPRNVLYRRQQTLLDQASICTVHAFCLDLLREHYARLDLSPDFRLAEDAILQNLREEAANQVIEEFYYQADPAFLELVELLSNPRDDRKLVKTMYDLHEFILSHPFPETWLKEKLTLYDESALPQESAFGKAILSYAVQALDYAIFLNRDAIHAVAKDSALEAAYFPSLKKDQELAEELKAAVHERRWDALREVLCQMKFCTLGRPKGTYDKELAQQIKRRRELFKKILSGLKERQLLGNSEDYRRDILELQPKVKALFSLVSAFERCFSEKKREKNFLDFSDLEHFALRLLIVEQGGGVLATPLALELRARYVEIMVDEYQDTNATQDLLFFALSQNGQNLFTVGDVKQSIYGFRQAEPKLFLQRQDTSKDYDGTYGSSRIFLSHNFRSRKNIVDSVNFLFSQLMTPETGGISYDSSQALVCGKDPEHPGPPVRFDILDTSVNKEQSTDQQEAQHVALLIRQLLDGKEQAVEEGRPLRPGDICILLRSPKNLSSLYEKALSQMGIESYSRIAGSYFLSREIMTLLSLLRVIDNPLQDLPLLSLLLSPLFSFSPDDLSALRMQSPNQALYPALLAAAQQGDLSCKELVQHLSHFRRLAANLPVGELLTRLYEETGYLFMAQKGMGGEERGDNLLLLLEYARSYERQGGGSLSGFLRFIDQVIERGGDLQQAKSLQAPENAVQIMSIHNSKGLEFPICILSGTARRINFQDVNDAACIHSELGFASIRRNLDTMQQFTTIPREALRLALRQDTVAEELRVLYVAATRSKQQLIFTAALSHPEKKIADLAGQMPTTKVLPPYLIQSASSYFDWLVMGYLRHPDAQKMREYASEMECLKTEGQMSFQFFSVAEKVPESNERELPVIQPDPELCKQMAQRLFYQYPYQAVVSLPAKVTVTDLVKQENTIGPLKRPRFITGQGLTAAEKGTALHRYMQFADYAMAAFNPEKELQRLYQLGYFTLEEKESISLSKLRRFFASPLFEQIQNASRMEREFSFVLQKRACEVFPLSNFLQDEFLSVQGMVDCLFGEGDSWTIADYKTDWISNEEAFIERYRPQLVLYREAVEKSFGQPVKACALYAFSLGKTIWL